LLSEGSKNAIVIALMYLAVHIPAKEHPWMLCVAIGQFDPRINSERKTVN
jgi:hypothetical protein